MVGDTQPCPSGEGTISLLKVQAYVDDQNLPKALKTQILMHFKNHPPLYYDSQKIIASLPSYLQADIMDVVFGEVRLVLPDLMTADDTITLDFCRGLREQTSEYGEACPCVPFPHRQAHPRESLLLALSSARLCPGAVIGPGGGGGYRVEFLYHKFCAKFTCAIVRCFEGFARVYVRLCLCSPGPCQRI